MKSLKSVLAVLMAVCLMMCLAVPAFATAETTGETTVATTGAAEETTGAAEETTGASEPTIVVDEHEGHDHGTQTEESGAVKVIRVILTVLEVIASIVLIVVVLMQSGKEAGLSSALSGNADSYLSKNGGSLDKLLAKSTKWIALIWVVLTLILTLL